MTAAPGPWTCPVCQRLLELQDRTWRCAAGHAFDQARQGYVNLIPGGHTPANHGDSAPMLEARRRFLGAGHYAPLVQALVAVVRGGPHTVILDAGCGEGHYVGELVWAFASSQCLATDVSKAAASMTARAHPRVRVAVADTHHHLPVANESVDVLLNVFAPRNPDEFARVLRPGGRVVTVLPDPRHLEELRDVLVLGIQPDKQQLVLAAMERSFTVVQQAAVEVPLTLTPATLQDLVAMTPNAFHPPAGTVANAPTGGTARFQLLVLARR